ncbi:MAG: N-acetylglucosamine-6-phosphate deacetylase [Clostridia bacterium]|nr:N-acetylglucosamine-6-phosphate deacetylase [Clostridia bacterium]
MSTLLIQNARAVLPDGVCEQTDLLLADGKITAIGYKGKADRVLDAKGNYLMAGFVDLHVHGGGGADFMDATPEAFALATATHLAHGTTLLYPTAMSATEADIAAFLRAYHAFCKQSPLAKCAPGVHLEGPYFAGAGKSSSGAQPTDVLRLPDLDEAQRLLAVGEGAILRWDAAPELEGASEFAAFLKQRGVLAAVGHTDATAEECARGYAAGFSHVTHFYNACSMHRKREQTVYAGVVEATYLDDAVSVELIGDGCHIPREDVLLALKIKGAQKVCVITDGTRLSGTTQKTGKLGSLTAGRDVIVEDGVAKLPDRSFFAGSIATMDRCLRVLVLKYGIDLPTASVLLSLAPATCMGVPQQKGSIEVGKDADLVLLDSDLTVQNVILGGVPREEIA